MRTKITDYLLADINHQNIDIDTDVEEIEITINWKVRFDEFETKVEIFADVHSFHVDARCYDIPTGKWRYIDEKVDNLTEWDITFNVPLEADTFPVQINIETVEINFRKKTLLIN